MLMLSMGDARGTFGTPVRGETGTAWREFGGH